MLEILLIVILWLYICLQLVVFAGLFMDSRRKNKLKDFPDIAILIPARNEADNIIDCLQSIVALDYPASKMEVWIGNDASEDQTAILVQDFIKDYPRFHLYSVTETLGSARAKSNVLEHLMRQSTADYCFVTDADIQVHPQWIQSLLPRLIEPNMGIVSGTTLVDGKSLFAKWQGLDWLQGNGYLIGLDRLGIKSTAVGNNMAFTRQAYFTTGGYAAMPFSVTEDFQLFRAIRQQGFHSHNALEFDSLNLSSAQNNLRAMLHQRKRWMIGARDLPWYWILIFGLQALLCPALILLLILHTQLALIIWGVKTLLQALLHLYIQVRLKHRINWLSLISFELYSFVTQILMIAFYLAPVKMEWKKRKY